MADWASIQTTAQNIATAINQAAATYVSVQGKSNVAGVTAATLVETGAGRVCVVSVIAAGSAAGFIYDVADVTSTLRPVYVIPMTVGVFVVNMPTRYGIVVAPGTGQTVTVSYS